MAVSYGCPVPAFAARQITAAQSVVAIAACDAAGLGGDSPMSKRARLAESGDTRRTSASREFLLRPFVQCRRLGLQTCHNPQQAALRRQIRNEGASIDNPIG